MSNNSRGRRLGISITVAGVLCIALGVSYWSVAGAAVTEHTRLVDNYAKERATGPAAGQSQDPLAKLRMRIGAFGGGEKGRRTTLIWFVSAGAILIATGAHISAGRLVAKADRP